jgi:L-malate glycosyltransferase
MAKKSDTKKKKVLMLNYEFPPLGGGAGNATYYILKEFEDKNVEVDLVTSSIDEFGIGKFSKNIKIHYLDIGKRGSLHFQTNRNLITYLFKSYKYTKELAKKKKYDITHAFFGFPCGYVAMQLKKKFNIPYVVSLRGSDVPFYNTRFYLLDMLFLKRVSKRIWKNAKAVVANSEGLKDLALRVKPKQKISIIHNGIDIQEFKPVEKKKLKKEKITLISTGRLIERKGYKYLIEAISGLRNVSLQLIGEGNLMDELKLQAKGANSNVNFLGKVKHEKIAEFLRDADIFVLPSLNEGMSNSILEGMACGLPIITTDTGGSKELIDGNGFIVEKSSSEDLRDAVNRYLEDLSLIEKHGKKSRKIAEEMSWGKVAKDYLKMYD